MPVFRVGLKYWSHRLRYSAYSSNRSHWCSDCLPISQQGILWFWYSSHWYLFWKTQVPILGAAWEHIHSISIVGIIYIRDWIIGSIYSNANVYTFDRFLYWSGHRRTSPCWKKLTIIEFCVNHYKLTNYGFYCSNWNGSCSDRCRNRGNIGGKAMEAIARQPEAIGDIRANMILDSSSCWRSSFDLSW